MSVTTPQYQTSIDQSKFVEPLKSSTRPDILIDKYFPESNYDTSIDSTLHKLLRSILGEAGVGALRKSFYEARLIFEEHGFQNHQLEKFYANPLRFGRNITSTPFSEDYSVDPLNILTPEQWKEIQSKDQAYRNRAIDFLHAARLGGTPEGIKIAAKSAAGYEFDLIETYAHMFDQHSDEVIGIEDFRIDQGNQIYDSSEFTLVPNQEISRSLVRFVQFENSHNIVKGYITIYFNGDSKNVEYNTVESEFKPLGFTAFDIQKAITSFVTVGVGNAQVTGNIHDGFRIKLFNNYSEAFDKSFNIESHLYYKTNLADRDVTAVPYPSDKIAMFQTWNSERAESAFVDQYDASLVDKAVDKIKPIDSYGGYLPGQSIYENQKIKSVSASSAYYEVSRHVTGNESIEWPEAINGHWIESGKENQAPRLQNQLKQHYQGFHKPISIIAYNEDALDDSAYYTSFPNESTSFSNNDNYLSQMTGEFNKGFTDAFKSVSYLTNREPTVPSLPRYALADFAEPMNITAYSEKYGFNLINNSYIHSNEVQEIISNIGNYTSSRQFWASDQDWAGSEYLEIDLGAPKAVNFVSFETFKVPINIEISYDTIGIGEQRNFVNAIPESNLYFNTSLKYDKNGSSLPWKYLSFNFVDRQNTIPFTRYVRIKFTRRYGVNDIFISRNRQNYGDPGQEPWPILVKNLRIGRNV